MKNIFHKLYIGFISFIKFAFYKFKYGKSFSAHLANSFKGLLKIELADKAELKFGKFTMTSGPAYFKIEEGARAEIGDNTFFNHNFSCTVRERVTIGNNCMFANNCVIVDHDHVISPDGNKGSDFSVQPVEIGNNVWVGANSVILKGVKIGDGAVVAAGAVVTKDIPDFEVWGGVPAKFIRKTKV